jgi:acetyl-CoA carboxylase biotin carboxyl carrier protein
VTLTDDDVREILRLIDESDLAELRIETNGFALHVRRSGATTPAPEQEHDAAPSETRDGLHTIAAPMLGTFYRAESPGASPFVEVGARVEPDTIVCIIEVMKMMNSIPAGIAGTIVEVVAENAQHVEYGEPLFRIEPA